MYTYTESDTELPIQSYSDSHAVATECFAIIYVKNSLDKGRQANIVNELNSMIGVEEAHFNPERQHLLVAKYNRFQLRAQDIVKELHRQNLHAVIAGC